MPRLSHWMFQSFSSSLLSTELNRSETAQLFVLVVVVDFFLSLSLSLSLPSFAPFCLLLLTNEATNKGREEEFSCSGTRRMLLNDPDGK